VKSPKTDYVSLEIHKPYSFTLFVRPVKNTQRCLFLQNVMPGFLTFAQLSFEPTHQSFYFVTIILIAQILRKNRLSVT